MRQGDSVWPLMLAVWTWLKTLLPWASLGFTEKSDSTRRSHTADKACDHQTLSPQKSNLQKLFCWRQLTALRDTGVVQIKHTYTTHWISATRFKCTLLVVHSINWFIVTNIFGEIHFWGGANEYSRVMWKVGLTFSWPLHTARWAWLCQLTGTIPENQSGKTSSQIIATILLWTAEMK